MKIQIISVGEPKKTYFKPAIAEYSRRLGHFSVTRISVKDNPHAYKKIGELVKGTHTIAVDEHGLQLSSADLALFFEKIESQGEKTLSLVVGPADGHPSDFLESADASIGLSQLTMPHELALLFLCESVYRSMCILTQHPYHRD